MRPFWPPPFAQLHAGTAAVIVNESDASQLKGTLNCQIV
jgi:hypothetical protein